MNTLVIDHGSSTFRAGLSSSETPSLVLESLVARHRNETEFRVPADENRSNLVVCRPVQNSLVLHPEQAQTMWAHAFSALHLDATQHEVLLSQSVDTNRKQRSLIREVFFEQFECGRVSLEQQAVLSLLAMGEESGLVLDSGASLTQVVPVYQGYLISPGAASQPLAGDAVDNYFRMLLRRSGYGFSSCHADSALLRKMKEKKALLNVQLQSDSSQQFLKEPYVLPDGSIVELTQEKYMAPEILFFPQKLGLDAVALPAFVKGQMEQCDLSLRHRLYQKIVVTGGNSLLNGFPQRLLNELRKALPKELPLSLTAKPDRQIQCWKGGHVAVGTAFHRQNGMSRAEYHEQGPAREK